MSEIKKKKYRIKGFVNKFRSDLLALVLAFAMSAAGLFVSNCPYPIWDSIDWLCVTENFVRSLFGDAEDRDDAYFINVSYDKQIADVKVEPNGIGHVAITDRKALLDFLTIVERANYKYIFLDIRFEKGYDTEWDKALFSKIESMKNIVLSHHYESPYTNEEGIEINGFGIADSLLLSKVAYNDYYTTIFSSNFTRYQYVQGGRPSVALRMYQDIDKKTIEHRGFFYFNDGTLCENCPYIPIKGTIGRPIGDGTAADYYNLGPFLLTLGEEDDLIKGMNGKIVVIGDFEDDKHDTYMGMLPGPYLTYLAYKYLSRGGNNVSMVVLLLMTTVFFLIVRSILQGRTMFPWGNPLLKFGLMKWFRRLLSWRITKFVSKFISYSLVFTLICTVIYLVSGYVFNVMIPTMFITIISSINDFKKTETI